MIDDHLRAAAVAVLNLCRERKLMVATAESCTGGLVAGCLTEVPGSSDVVERGFVTYSNDAKQEMLGVGADILREHGAVSRAAAEAMAQGAIARSRAHLAVSVTGVAGPGGGTPAKPVGLVHFAGATRDGRLMHREQRYGDIGRSQIRRASVLEALDLLRMLAAAPSARLP
jgi:nicotinamide-nucleotide amidase